MDIRSDYSLQALHTMGCQSMARAYIKVNSVEELALANTYARNNGMKVVILGGGSNLIFSESVDALVIHLDIRGIEVKSSQTGETGRIQAGAGENWHEFVRWTLDQGYAGLENLSLIPGTVGAAPIQNIGAYGVEVSERIVHVSAYDCDSGELIHLGASECGFGYRESRFKHDLNRHVVVAVEFELDIGLQHPVLDYAELNRKWLEAGSPASADQIGRLVEQIRKAKLPDPRQIPNSGSFFKNPVVPAELFQTLQKDYPHIVAFPLPDNQWKLAAGWLIQECGWKGWLEDGVGVYEKQALVIVNPGNQSASKVKWLAQRVVDSVRARFGVELEQEPILI